MDNHIQYIVPHLGTWHWTANLTWSARTFWKWNGIEWQMSVDHTKRDYHVKRELFESTFEGGMLKVNYWGSQLKEVESQSLRCAIESFLAEMTFDRKCVGMRAFTSRSSQWHKLSAVLASRLQVSLSECRSLGNNWAAGWVDKHEKGVVSGVVLEIAAGHPLGHLHLGIEECRGCEGCTVGLDNKYLQGMLLGLQDHNLV